MTPVPNHAFFDRNRHGYGRGRPVSVWTFSAVHEERRVVSFPPFIMGQYFKALNLDKREVLCPWCIGGGSKLWEWAANPSGAVLTLLLRQSTDGGGGDYKGPTYEYDQSAIVGRWAGDRVALVGDYDSSKLWDQLSTYRNVSQELVETWNDFIEIPELKLEFNPTCGCRKGARR